jgi:excisionase family DNA binding protein
MTEHRWITVDDAAKAVNRSKRTIYNWINSGHLRALQDEQNRTVVNAKQLVEVEPTIRRGRPIGSARPPFAVRRSA